MPAELKTKLEIAASNNRRSITAELIARLEDSFALREGLSTEIHGAQPTEHDAAMLVLMRMYQETLDRVADLKAKSNLSTLEQVELQHEEATAKYLRQAAARASMPIEERPPQRKQSMPLGIDTDAHLAAMAAQNAPTPKSKK